MNDPKSRMFSPRTIVGGRPDGRRESLRGVPRGIEVLLRKASVDGEFRSLLLEDAEGAARSIGLDLSAGESAVLSAVPADQIERMVDHVHVPEEHRPVFRGRVAAAMIALLAGTMAVGCTEPPPAVGGIVVDPDRPRQEQPAEDPKEGEETGKVEGVVPGERSDLPEPVVILGLRVMDPEEIVSPEDEPEEPR